MLLRAEKRPSALPSAKEIIWFRRRMLGWFYAHGRRFPWRNKSASRYRKVIAEVLLQRTQAATVGRFFPHFIKRFPSWGELALASEEQFREYLQPLGLWRRRAASLHELASEMVRRRGRFPRTRDQIEALPGVGQYIANAILLLCHGDPEPLLDVNMARVIERYFGPRHLADIRYDPYLQALAKAVVAGKQSTMINWAVLDHASLVCKRRLPLCGICPVARHCSYAEQIDLGAR
jgi:A/G-specific adenine glycosylase